MSTQPAPDPLPGDAETFSAWFDGEATDPAAEAAFAARLVRDPALRRQYEHWCLVGDALRSHEVAAHHSPRLCARINTALEAEPAILAPRALPRAMPRGLRRNVASGAAVAAAFAVLAFFALPQLRSALPGGAADPGAGIARVQPGAPSATAPASLAMEAARRQRLEPYLQAHRDLAGQGVMPAAAIYLRSGPEGEH